MLKAGRNQTAKSSYASPMPATKVMHVIKGPHK